MAKVIEALQELENKLRNAHEEFSPDEILEDLRAIVILAEGEGE